CSNGSTQSTAMVTLTVRDTTAPSISCPAPVIAECTGNRHAVVDPGAATAGDVCSPVAVTNPSLGAFPLGTTVTAFTASDACGNGASCQSSVTVVDTTPPSIGCPAPIVAECTDNASAFVAPGVASAGDN